MYDNDRRLADHFGGKLHIGFVTIREKIKLLEVCLSVCVCLCVCVCWGGVCVWMNGCECVMVPGMVVYHFACHCMSAGYDQREDREEVS